MIRPLPHSVSILCIIILSTVPVSISASTFSGKVIDNAGNPVPEITIALEPSTRDIHFHQPHLVQRIAGGPLLSKTDSTGTFSIEEIETRIPYQFTLMPQHESDYEIKEIEIESISIYMDPYQFSRNRGFPFVIDKNTDIKDIKVIVRPRMYIRGQVVLPDGSPLKNERVNLRMKAQYLGGSSSSGGTYTLDAKGYFKRYVYQPAIYTIDLTYQDQTVESKQIHLDEGQRIDGITIKLKENPKPQPEKINAAKIQPAVNRAAVWERRRNGVWVINPINRHAYRRIYCQTYEEAINKANKFEAHLLTINDKEEQQWILDVFGRANFWIGLTKSEKNENKNWDNGEPVTYTNFDKIDIKSKGITERKPNITALIGLTGKWMQMQQDSPVTGLIQDAILEKAHLAVNLPASEDNN